MWLEFKSLDGLRKLAVEVIPNGSVGLLAGLGTYRLTIDVEVGANENDEGRLIDLAGEVFVEGSGPRWLGALARTQIVLRRFKTTEQLVVAVSDQQLLALEDVRRGRDLVLNLDLHGGLPGSDGLWPMAHAQGGRIYVPASRWTQALEGTGRAVAVTVTVPLPVDDGPLRQAGDLLREAKQQINAGEYGPSVVTVRRAMDQLRAVAPWTNPPRDRPARERTQDERWAVLCQGVVDQASGAAHADGVTADFHYSRDDAITLLAAATGLLSRAATIPRP